MPDYTTGQDLERQWRTFTDQHDRKWGATCSKKTGHPCSLLEPQFDAPLMPPHGVIRLDPNDDRMIVIDYNQWIDSIEAGERQWLEEVEKHAISLGVQGTVQEIIQNPPPEILRLAGPRPKRSTTPVLAAKAGNLWVLGLSTVVPEKAKDYFPEFFQPAETVYAETDPFAEDEVTLDPFAEDEVEVPLPPEEEPQAASVEEPTREVRDLGDGFWIVDGMKHPFWTNPKDGWLLSNKKLVPRGKNMHKDDYRALALEQERALHV